MKLSVGDLVWCNEGRFAHKLVTVKSLAKMSGKVVIEYKGQLDEVFSDILEESPFRA